MNLKDMNYVIGKNFSVKGRECNGGSRTLDGYIPIFNATVVEKLENAGAILKSQENVCEFEIANDFACETAHDVALGNADFGIGTSNNATLRKASNALRIIGYKPTYGMISRAGLYPVASTFDTVGIYAPNVKTAALVANELKGICEDDMNTWDSSNIDLVKDLENKNKKKFFYIKELANTDFLNELNDKNIEATEESININLINSINLIHNTILSAETTTTLSNLTGIPFGNSEKAKDADEIMLNFRSKFGTEVKEKLVIGAYSLSKDNLNKFYYNSLRLRKLLVVELNKLFDKYDALISSVDEKCLLIANLGGYPSVSVNGIVITGKQMSDANILNVAHNLEGGE